METVTGIGGLFFRARDPETLSRWYARHLGVTVAPGDFNAPPWRQEAGPTVFAPFPGHIDPRDYPNGRFARLHDPEGNPIELSEPRGPGAASP